MPTGVPQMLLSVSFGIGRFDLTLMIPVKRTSLSWIQYIVVKTFWKFGPLRLPLWKYPKRVGGNTKFSSSLRRSNVIPTVKREIPWIRHFCSFKYLLNCWIWEQGTSSQTEWWIIIKRIVFFFNTIMINIVFRRNTVWSYHFNYSRIKQACHMMIVVIFRRFRIYYSKNYRSRYGLK